MCQIPPPETPPPPRQPHLEERTVVPHFTKPKVFRQQRTRVVLSQKYPVWCARQKESPQELVEDMSNKDPLELEFCHSSRAGRGLSASSSSGTSSYGPSSSTPVEVSGKVSALSPSSFPSSSGFDS